jgi:hypothetical protein
MMDLLEMLERAGAIRRRLPAVAAEGQDAIRERRFKKQIPRSQTFAGDAMPMRCRVKCISKAKTSKADRAELAALLGLQHRVCPHTWCLCAR